VPNIVVPQITIRPASVDVVRAHGQRLLEDHWEEVALNKSVMRLDPEWKRYYAMEEQGMLFSLGAWMAAPHPEVPDELVGYAVTFALTHIHYAGLFYLQNDVLFVAKRARHTGVGPKMIVATEGEARARGAKLVMWHAKPGTALDALMPRMGYQIQDVVYSKEIS